MKKKAARRVGDFSQLQDPAGENLVEVALAPAGADATAARDPMVRWWKGLVASGQLVERETTPLSQKQELYALASPFKSPLHITYFF